MAEKCTKTSSPVERWINPYPFAPLNHFTVPFSLTESTPFTEREELLPRNPRSKPRSTEAPPQENRRKAASLGAWNETFQKEKTLLRPPARREKCCGIFGADNLACLNHWTQKLTAGLTTRPLVRY